jgi:hypothetical protein
MICFAKPGQAEHLYMVKREEFSTTCFMYGTYIDERPSIYIGGNPIFSSERMLHKDYDRKGSVEKIKISGRECQGA